MTIHDVTIAKIQQLPESLVQEVSDFIDFLLVKHDRARWQLWVHFAEALEMAESDFADYLSNLGDYEDRLASGEIHLNLKHPSGSPRLRGGDNDEMQR